MKNIKQLLLLSILCSLVLFTNCDEDEGNEDEDYIGLDGFFDFFYISLSGYMFDGEVASFFIFCNFILLCPFDVVITNFTNVSRLVSNSLFTFFTNLTNASIQAHIILVVNW